MGIQQDAGSPGAARRPRAGGHLAQGSWDGRSSEGDPGAKLVVCFSWGPQSQPVPHPADTEYGGGQGIKEVGSGSGRLAGLLGHR